MAMRPPLHLPRNHEENLVDDKLLKRVGRLNAAAKAIEQMDLKAIAESYQKESGASGLEAASVAAAALNAALKASLAGNQGSEAAEKEIESLAKRRARDARSEELIQARSQEDSKAAQGVRANIHASLDAKADRAVSCKEERLTEDAATRRALREERMFAASSRRTISEARKRIGQGSHGGRSTSVPSGSSSSSASHAVETDDPVLRRAQALVSGAAGVIAQLEEQNQMLLRKSAVSHGRAAPAGVASSSTSAAPARLATPLAKAGTPSSRLGDAHARFTNAQEEALLARANELLADYKPAELQKKPRVPTVASPKTGIDADGMAKLNKARHLCGAVDVAVKR